MAVQFIISIQLYQQLWQHKKKKKNNLAKNDTSEKRNIGTIM